MKDNTLRVGVEKILEPLLIDATTGGPKDYDATESFSEAQAELEALLAEEVRKARIEVYKDVLSTRGIDGCNGYCDADFVEDRIKQLVKEGK